MGINLAATLEKEDLDDDDGEEEFDEDGELDIDDEDFPDFALKFDAVLHGTPADRLELVCQVC